MSDKPERKILDIVGSANKIAISGHVRPDGDCVGSTVGLYNYLKENTDKDVTVYIDEPSDDLKVLSGTENIVTDIPENERFDLFFMMDCSEASRLGKRDVLIKNSDVTVCIDHHVCKLGICRENYIFPESSSTCEVLYEMLDNDKISKKTAECLYTGIIHDTGVFHHNCTSHRTMDIAGYLMDKGIDYPSIIDDGFYSKTYKQNQILGRCLMESMLLWNGEVIVSYLTRKELEFYMADGKDLGGIIDQLRLTKGIKVAIFLYETENQVYKVSMRSTVTDIDLTKVAGYFGGGGHKMAAGCTISGNAHDCINSITKQLEVILRELNYIE